MSVDHVDGSSAIRALEYRAEEKAVRVHFHSGHWHDYGPLTADEYQEFLTAKSVGEHFHKHVKAKEL